MVVKKNKPVRSIGKAKTQDEIDTEKLKKNIEETKEILDKKETKTEAEKIASEEEDDALIRRFEEAKARKNQKNMEEFDKELKILCDKYNVFLDAQVLIKPKQR